MGSLISTFDFRLLEHRLSRLATSKIPIFYLVSVAEHTGLNLTLSEFPKTGFVTLRPICCSAQWESIKKHFTQHMRT